ncbi:hypothetical protein BGX31_001102 [Mortierella sp. GBA43]|nr:hypothetical protein BGX31_001102 [Mortierella sp. GBA43]
MVFGGTVSSPRGTLSVTQSLALANIYLENATQAQDPDIALVLCHDTATSLTQVRKVCRRSEDEAIRKEVAIAYISLGQVLASYGHQMEAQASYNKAKKWGEKVQDHLQLFTENVRLTAVVDRLPAPDERLANTLQLACCLALLKDSHSYDDILGPAARNWLQTVKNNEDEQERLKILATSVIKEFKKEIKDAKSVSEVVCLAPILEKDDFQDLLLEFYNGVNGSLLPDFYQLDGLARMIQAAGPGYLHVHDLVKILGALAARLQNTQKHAPQHMFQLVLAASHVLDAMADTHIEGLDHETLHQPLMSYLDSFKGSSDPFMMYQVAYAYQALLYVPGNEKLWQATLRRTSKVTQGVLGLVSAERGLNLNGFLDGLKDIQQGTSSTAGMTKTVAAIFDGTSDLTSGGHGFLEGLKEGSSFQSKCAWYPALRGADAFIRDGDFIAFKQLVYEVPCRLDLPFQWGVCQRLGEIAINQSWDVSTQQSAATLLGEIYRNTEDWGDHSSIQDAIIAILTRLESSTGSISQFTESLLRELESRTDPDERNLLLERRKKDPNTCPLKPALPPLGSPSLVDRVQNKPDVEGSLRRLRNQRLKERSDAVYIPPQAKENLPFSYGVRFSLTEKVKEFIGSEQKVFLVLGDSGAGKSTFIRRLECDLWQDYKNTRRIPLHINLPAIDKPEQDLIAKQLRKLEFTDPEILELKTRRRFILICDGYDESQQTHNLYMSNRLNQKGEWKAQMIVSCHSDYIGDDYQDQFQPEDDNRPDPGQYQEAVITPFSEDQVHDYIKQFVSLHQPLWEVKDYTRALDLIPCLKDVVKNPFLLVLSLEVLPRMMDPGEHISDTRVTRVALYDHFIEHWLERGEIRLREKKMTPQAKSTFEELVEDGFTRNAVDFLKRLAVSIYKEQSGQPIVLYSRAQDEGTWKAEFFGREDEKQILREESVSVPSPVTSGVCIGTVDIRSSSLERAVGTNSKLMSSREH